MKHRPLLLVVNDGWGEREAVEWNAVAAGAPYVAELRARYPHALLSASGREVGLPLGLMGNSEVGHLNLGAGRTVYQDTTRIDKAIEDGSFLENGALRGLCERVKRSGRTLHLMGLVSDGGVHSSDHHLRNLLVLAARVGLAPDKVCVHAVLDGRDTPPRFGLRYVEALERDLSAAGVGRIASVIGRYWAMDRDRRWERVQRAYELFVHGKGERAATAREAVETSYAREQGDEFVEPFAIGGPSPGDPIGQPADRMADGDGLLCFNFRADRMREICSALGLEDFDGFERGTRPRLDIVTMTQYRADFPFPVAFAPVLLEGLFGDVVSAAGLLQKRMAETEKYAHVTFFFSGGCETPVPGETRVLVPSPKVATYDLKPEMSAPELCDAIMASLREDRTDVYVINFANADMVGHTGVYDAAVKAVATIDACLQRIVPEVVRRGGAVVITADHGNAELMWDAANDMPHTAHTTNPVPIVVCAEDVVGARLRPMGTLADVAPTLLELAGLEPSSGMDGVSMLRP